jgi:hypothetical protein
MDETHRLPPNGLRLSCGNVLMKLALKVLSRAKTDINNVRSSSERTLLIEANAQSVSLSRLLGGSETTIDDFVQPLPTEIEKGFRRMEFELIDEDIAEMIVENKDSATHLDMERIIRLQTLRYLRQLAKA